MKSDVQYKHDSEDVLEALGIKKGHADMAKTSEQLKKAIADDKGHRTSFMVSKIIEVSDSPEEACLIALRMGQERGKSQGKHETIARVIAAAMSDEDISVVPHMLGVPGMCDDDEDDCGPVGNIPTSTYNGNDDRMYV